MNARAPHLFVAGTGQADWLGVDMAERTAAYGFGTIYQRSRDGLWLCAVELPRATGEQRCRKVFTGHSRDEVAAKLDAYRDGYETAPPLDGGRQAYLARAAGQARHTRQEWWRLVRERDGLCDYCGVKTFDAAVVKVMGKDPHRTLVKDHRTPLVRGGSDGIDNIAVSCRRCNIEKGTMTADEYLAWKATR